MLHKETELQQETNNSHIFGANALGVLKSYSIFTRSGSGIAALGLIPWAITLPVSLLGSVVKSVVDISNRQKLSQTELDTTVATIESLGGETLENFIAKISLYQPSAQSHSSAQVFTQLGITKVAYQLRVAGTKLNEEEKLKQQRQVEIEQELQDFVSDKEYGSRVGLVASYKLSSQDKKLAEDKVNEKLPELQAKTDQIIKENLIHFMREPYNAGKKLQHVIKDAADEIRSLRKP